MKLYPIRVRSRTCGWTEGTRAIADSAGMVRPIHHLGVTAGLLLAVMAVRGAEPPAPPPAAPGGAPESVAVPDMAARWRAMYGDEAVVRLAPSAPAALLARPPGAPRGGALLLAPPGRDADARPLIGPLRAALAVRGWLALSVVAAPAVVDPALAWLRRAPAPPALVVASGRAAGEALAAVPALAAAGVTAVVLVDAQVSAAEALAEPALERLAVLELIGGRAPEVAARAAVARLRAARERGLRWRLERLAGAVRAAEDWQRVLARVDAWGRARLADAGGG